VHALRNFGWPAREAEFSARVIRARDWLQAVQPDVHEGRVFQILGLRWAGVPSAELQAKAQVLLDQQRPDGGWSQLPGLTSDAYATGEALFALHEAGTITPQSAIDRATAFLLRTQENDGTWHVQRRAFPFQPTMDSGFPHGRDSWISCAGTSWAVMGLSRWMPEITDATVLIRSVPAAKVRGAKNAEGVARIAHEGLVDFKQDIQPLLERSCVKCHSGEHPRSGYRVTSRESFLSMAAQGRPTVVPGKSHESFLLRYVADEVEELEMPPKAKRDAFPALTPDEIARLRAWIDQGVPWPAELKLSRVE
jgi:hypothetical protein